MNRTPIRYRYCMPIMLLCMHAAMMHAQQLPVYSQYMMNAFLLNPAVAGHEGYTAINVTAREQWLGLKDAPGTYSVSAQTRLLRNSFISRSSSVRKRKGSCHAADVSDMACMPLRIWPEPLIARASREPIAFTFNSLPLSCHLAYPYRLPVQN